MHLAGAVQRSQQIGLLEGRLGTPMFPISRRMARFQAQLGDLSEEDAVVPSSGRRSTVGRRAGASWGRDSALGGSLTLSRRQLNFGRDNDIEARGNEGAEGAYGEPRGVQGNPFMNV